MVMDNGYLDYDQFNVAARRYDEQDIIMDNGYLGYDQFNEAERIRLMNNLNHHQQQQQDGGQSVDISGESRPLGLKLRKTPSFVDLIESKLSQRNDNSMYQTYHDTTTTTHNEKSPKARANNFAIRPMSSEKWKASNFCASLLRIGSWERVAKHEGDLVAKCYYAKRKLVWEILDRGLKSKIEVQWRDISAIRAVFQENQPGILELELENPPVYGKEMSPQPRKHTLWQQSADFTGGQAPSYRRHYLQFPEGTLEKHYQKILQCDSRLFLLSQRPFPSSNSAFFHSSNEYHQDFYLNFNGHQPSPQLQYPQFGSQRPMLHPSCEDYKFNPASRPPVAPRIQMSHLQGTNVPFTESLGNQGIQRMTSFSNQRTTNEDFFYRPEEEYRVQEPAYIANMNQVHAYLPQYDSFLENSRRNETTFNSNAPCELSNIGKDLLDEQDAATVHSSDQQAYLAARVRSMNCLLGLADNTGFDVSYEENNYSSMEPTYTQQSHYDMELTSTLGQPNGAMFMVQSFPSTEPSMEQIEYPTKGPQNYWRNC
ncbi:hypothetical protein C5167_015932 [Papaver somniferum]|uniref:uncharacterized protein LOC113332971 n=1 Tax=Papaver somniferum TaxID=3469 RepID=UPI000E701966|nr:uncharacterized protein LOC113332971 [Papaver somniferum]RZC88128.1 hypothetical protein C5167_015932 [Papaver somniferum]